MILSENSRAPGDAVGRAKEWRALKRRSPTKHICSSESWPGSFIAGTAPSFRIKGCANPVSNWALFIKRSSTNTLVKLHCCPIKQTASTVHATLGSFGKLNKVIFPLQPNFFRDILPERVSCRAAGWSTLIGTLLLSRWSMRAQVRSSGRNAHIRSSTPHYVRKSHDWKNFQKLVKKKTEGRFLAQKYSVILPNLSFFLLWPCLAWESNSLTV